MTLPVYHDRDCDLSIIRNRKVLVIGYGSQGRTQALNARDSGVTQIKVALKPASTTRARAEADGFDVVTVADGVTWADVLVVLTSDEAHQSLFRDEIAPNLRAGQALIFAHGLSVNFGLVTPPADVDVLLVSPKGIGPRIRDIYVAGEGVFCLFAVQQDATGHAKTLGLSFAAALGCGRKCILETTMKAECESDLFGEQVVLCGGTRELVTNGFQTLVDAGYPPEVAWFETCYELKLVVDLLWELGMSGGFAKISNTAEYGAYLTGPRVINDASKAAMQEVLKDVQSGDFVRRLMADYDAGSPDLLARREALKNNLLDRTKDYLDGISDAGVKKT
ncbi:MULTISPECIES: ketol-acid reductoisomerase [Asticcacaulis]|uniref:ketol-acid reductoisomerase n=1 Tax=Asticcacaulis TaxID=76890 RepID=UPI001AEA79BB|nr:MULTISPECIES: ketol-acid reductoisomerase [Asticcacaulis]MBP2160929.1 ketol-acid reductoisomerase [Asticcacaulis solisilvae]MDR6801867.1 ketol-acid reductoisomerase [Asticcacaulis sp. BE141]